MTKHVHHEAITAWANGEIIEWSFDGETWRSLNNNEPRFDEMLKYRVKPAEIERIYPETQQTDGDLVSNYYGGGPVAKNQEYEAWRRVANSALRHACDNGQIVTREEFDRAVGDRKARDMDVARAVDAWYCQTFSNKQPNTENYLADIIKGIKP